MKSSICIKFLFCLLGIVSVAGAEKWYVDLSLEDALTKAKEEKKVVFVDFYATWCGPCKLMEAQTFTNEKVIKWLKEYTIAIKIDGDKNASLCRKYQVVSFPTLLFLRPDGSEIDRLLGFRAVDDFLKHAEMFKDGKDSLTRAKEAIAKNPKDPAGHLQLATMYAEKGQNDKALEEYLWCLDKGWEDPYSDFMIGVLPQLYGNLQYLGYHSPQVGQELRTRRDQARKALLDGKGSVREIWLMVFGNQLFEDGDSIEVYEKVVNNEKTPEKLKNDFTLAVLDPLLAGHRYADIDKYLDLKAQVEKAFSNYEAHKKQIEEQVAGLPPEYRQQAEDQAKAQTVTHAGFVYQVLLGLGKTDEAAALARRILAFDDSANSNYYLAYSGLQSGKPVEANIKQALRANQLTDGKIAQVFDTLARLYKAMGQQEKAVAAAEEGLKVAANFQERLLMQKTLDAVKPK